MSQTKKKHCEPLVAVWLRPSTTEPCICCKQVAEKPRGEHLKMMYVCMYVLMHFVPSCPVAGFLYSSTVSTRSSYIIRKFDPPTPSLDVVKTIKKIRHIIL